MSTNKVAGWRQVFAVNRAEVERRLQNGYYKAHPDEHTKDHYKSFEGWNKNSEWELEVAKKVVDANPGLELDALADLFLQEWNASDYDKLAAELGQPAMRSAAARYYIRQAQGESARDAMGEIW